MPAWLWLLLATASLVAVAALLGIMFVRESGRRRLFPLVRPLYRRVLNPKALQAHARGDRRWAVIHHVGRRSGTPYDTPVDAQRTADGVVIALVYGPAADWCRNVLAAGHCTLSLDGEQLALDTPRVITLSLALPSLSEERARLWRSIGIEHCLSLRLTPA